MKCQSCSSTLPIHAPDCPRVHMIPHQWAISGKSISNAIAAGHFARRYTSRIGQPDSNGQIIPPAVREGARRLVRWAREP